MAGEVYSPSMNLPVPQPGITDGPQYAIDINVCLALIDGHNHTPGYGVPIPVAGLNIDADLSMGGHNLTTIRSTRFQAQSIPISAASDLGCLYEAGVDLYYNDGSGNQVRITQSGALAGTPGSIANLVSPATATYVSAGETFVWQSDANTPANMDAASYIFRNLVANSKGLTVNPPNAMAADYTLTLPPLPSSQKIMTLDASGNITAPYIVDGTTIGISSNVLGVLAAGLIDNVTIGASSNQLFWKNGYITYDFTINGNYSFFTVPADELDGLRFFNYNATIVNIWAYIGTPGASGTTQLDLQLATSPGGPFISIFSTKPAFTSAASANAYVDAHGVVAPGTGVTAPVLSSSIIAAGSAMRFSLTSVQSGTAVNGAGIVVQFKQRN